MNATPSNDDASRWRLRTADGALYGPAKLEKMILWAEEGKILPGCSLSQDEQTWIPAENIAALDLRWYIHDGSGQLRGPLNKRAAQNLINAAPNSAALRLVSAREASAPHLRPLVKAPEPDTPLLQGLDLPDPEPRVLKNKPETIALKNQITQLQNEFAEKETSLQQRIDQLTQNEASLQSTITQLQAELAQKDTQFNDSTSDAINELTALQDSNDELQRAVKSLTAELAQKDTALIQLQSQHTHLATRHTQLQHDLANSAAQLADTQARLDAELREHTLTRDQLAELQTQHTQLLADFAELTDLANTRDNDLSETISRLQHDLDQARTRTPSALDDLRPLLLEEIDALDKDLDHERVTAEAIKSLSAQRQAALQNRQQLILQKLNAAPAPTNPDAYLKTGAQTRLQADLQLLRDTHAIEMRKSEEREHALLRKLRATESSLDSLRAQVANIDNRAQTNRELNETISRLKQQLLTLQKHRDADINRFDSERSALLNRITQLETPPPNSPNPNRDDPPSRFRFMTLKK